MITVILFDSSLNDLAISCFSYDVRFESHGNFRFYNCQNRRLLISVGRSESSRPMQSVDWVTFNFFFHEHNGALNSPTFARLMVFHKQLRVVLFVQFWSTQTVCWSGLWAHTTVNIRTISFSLNPLNHVLWLTSRN